MLFHFLSHIYALPAVHFQSALVVEFLFLVFCFEHSGFLFNPIGNYTVVSELLKCGYRSLEAKNQEGQTAVHLASRMGKDDILKKLIESGANINCRDTAGYTPLHVGSLLIVCQIYFGINCSSIQFGC
jgi:FOG: Ankyrin repeat